MAKTYTENKRLIQPLYQRYRNIFRGSRDSKKENLEMNKILIDFYRLDDKADELIAKSYNDIRILIGQVDPEAVGIHIPGDDGIYYAFEDIKVHFADDSATPNYVEVDTTFTISGKMSRMLKKIKNLEKKGKA
jgi:hypothetical protein